MVEEVQGEWGEHSGAPTWPSADNPQLPAPFFLHPVSHSEPVEHGQAELVPHGVPTHHFRPRGYSWLAWLLPDSAACWGYGMGEGSSGRAVGSLCVYVSVHLCVSARVCDS